ncbi:hypothetical protein Bca52824_024741 [Brassica carinata]|uniref:Uncharacterized protein n=1 Tax=Brassica carinata TaxID=52824 RepID=A0A8X7VKM4_BRACI|nr:hypothetical protein Bca52824_024741 [Brassica carinata]
MGPSPPSTAASKIPRVSLFDDEDFLDDIPTQPTNTTTIPHTAPSKINRFSLIDETISCGDEMLEEMFKEAPDTIPDSWIAEEEEETGSETSLPPDIAEVMAGIHVPKTAPHIIHCTTSDAFDHTVLVSGELPIHWKHEPNDSSV